MALREIDLILRSAIRILERAQKLRRAQNYELAQLVALAVNNPKELPSPDAFLGEPRQKRYAAFDHPPRAAGHGALVRAAAK